MKTQTGPINAKLVEFVKSSGLNTKYEFQDWHNFKRSEENGSNLVLVTFKHEDEVDKSEVKRQAMTIFEREYNKKLQLFEENEFRDKSISDLRDIQKDEMEKLENLKAKHYYNPFGNKYWKTPISGIRFAAKLLAGMSTFDMITKINSTPNNENLYLATLIPVTLGYALEYIRRDNIQGSSDKLKMATSNITCYDNFMRNIENANVLVKQSDVAKNMFDNLKSLKDSGKSEFIGVSETNKKLKNIYLDNLVL